MEEIKQGWKKRISWLLIAITVVIVYKMLDNFSNVTEWFGTFFRILKPFLAGLLISYILFMPCKKIEGMLEKSKLKFVKKKARGLSVIATYIIFVLIVIIIINCIFPVLKESVVELVGNIPGYYEILVNKYKELPEDSVLKSDVIKDKMTELSNIDMKQFLSINNEKIIEYVKNNYNLSVSSNNIAEVKVKNNLQQQNREYKKSKTPCPENKVNAIENAFKHFNILL